MGKHMFDETDSKVQSFSKVLDSLMQQFRDRAARETVIDIHHMGKIRPHIHSEHLPTLCGM